jgi:hypothetical protein
MAGQEGFEPPTLGFGDRCSNQTELLACAEFSPFFLNMKLLHFLMFRMMTAPRTILLSFQFVRSILFILGCAVVAAFAFSALQLNDIAHD